MIDTRSYAAFDTLKDGTAVTVRAIRADDREAIAAPLRPLIASRSTRASSPTRRS